MRKRDPSRIVFIDIADLVPRPVRPDEIGVIVIEGGWV